MWNSKRVPRMWKVSATRTLSPPTRAATWSTPTSTSTANSTFVRLSKPGRRAVAAPLRGRSICPVGTSTRILAADCTMKTDCLSIEAAPLPPPGSRLTLKKNPGLLTVPPKVLMATPVLSMNLTGRKGAWNCNSNYIAAEARLAESGMRFGIR